MPYNEDTFRTQAEEWYNAIYHLHFPEDIALGCVAFADAMAGAESVWHEGEPGIEDQQTVLHRLYTVALALVDELDKEIRA